MAALDHFVEMIFHVVAEVIEAQLVVGGIGYVAGIHLPALVVRQAMDNDAGGEAQETVNLAHPGGVALGQIVVDGDDVNALACKGVEVNRKGRDKGFAFAGFHFGNGAVVQNHAADHLHVKMAHAKGALGGFADHGKGRNKEIVQSLAGGQFGLKLAVLAFRSASERAANSASSWFISSTGARYLTTFRSLFVPKSFAAIERSPSI